MSSVGPGVIGRVGSRNRTVQGPTLSTRQTLASAVSPSLVARRIRGRKLNFFEQIGPIKSFSDGPDDHLEEFAFRLKFHLAFGGVDIDVNLVGRDGQKEYPQGETPRRQQFPVAATQGRRQGLAFHRTFVHEEVLPGPGIAGTTGRTDEASQPNALFGQGCVRTREREEFLGPLLADNRAGAQGELSLRRCLKHLASV